MVIIYNLYYCTQIVFNRSIGFEVCLRILKGKLFKKFRWKINITITPMDMEASAILNIGEKR